MTKEELLKPRYKVIADYPESGFKVGEILPNLLPEWTTEEQREFTLKECAKYPHLFKKLEWWEERKAEEMPRYLKISGVIYSVERYLFAFETASVRDPRTDEHHSTSLINCIPATLEEFNSQSK